MPRLSPSRRLSADISAGEIVAGADVAAAARAGLASGPTAWSRQPLTSSLRRRLAMAGSCAGRSQ